MAGRPKSDDSRNSQYRIRLNDEENNKLEYVSSVTGQPKSEVFRRAITELYRVTKMNEAIADFEGEYDDFGIDLKRAIECPYCKHLNILNMTEYSDISSSERGMGPETLYDFDFNEFCDECGHEFHVYGYISEYPMGALNHEDIDVEEIEED